VAFFRERIHEYPLPEPISKIVLTYATLCDPLNIIQVVTFQSIAVYDDFDDCIAYYEQLNALSLGCQGFNPAYGLDPGPPPPRESPTQVSLPEVPTVLQIPTPMAGRGFNTFHGFDSGPAPPGFAPTQPFGMPQYPAFFGAPAPPQGFGWPAPAPIQYPAFPQQPVFMPPYGGFGPGGTTYPAIAPFTDHGFPGIHLRNHTGGVGLPPGYDYAFPQEHCKIHVFKTKEKPWQTTLWKEDNSKHVKLFVPTGTTIKELMRNLGCTNEDAKKNIMYEVVESGNGQWKVGAKFAGDDKDKVKKAISEYGFRGDRTGHPGEKPVVWLWVTKDGQ
jgi:hypothetical protein